LVAHRRDPAQGSQEGLTGQVFGQRTVTHAEQDEPEDHIDITVVKLAEGVLVALLGGRDEVPCRGVDLWPGVFDPGTLGWLVRGARLW
jgi:hypothetical protein